MSLCSVAVEVEGAGVKDPPEVLQTLLLAVQGLVEGVERSFGFQRWL
jgi:hypothetical protein